MVVPLAVINHYRPVRPLPEPYRIDELYPEGINPRKLRLSWDRQVWSARNFFLALDRMLKVHEKLPIKPFRRRALRVAEQWILERIGEGSDGLGAIFPAMVYALIALECLGYTEDHPIFQKALKDLQDLEVYDPEDDSLRVRPCFSPTWDTAMSVIALTKAGVPSDDPAIRKAAEWLLKKEIRRFGDWHKKNPYPEASGWAFEFNNEFYPDVDDTVMVLLALNRADSSDPNYKLQVMRRATGWVRSFQCKNGGFAAFDKDVTKPWLEKIPFADHNAILDPPCSDISGRVLEWMGHAGYKPTDEVVARTIQFLRQIQESDGSWFGRWGVNYIYGTWQALRGLRAVGLDMKEPWIQRALQWLESCQNEDGGWGETAASYEDVSLKGKGPSGPTQTAWALMGIMAAGGADRPSVQRGIEYLLRTQNPDGTWDETTTNGTGFPRVYYLRYDVYRYVWPLVALAEYREATWQDQQKEQRMKASDQEVSSSKALGTSEMAG